MIEYYKDEDLDKISKNQKKYKIIYGIILFCLIVIHAVVILVFPDQKIIFIGIQVILDAVIFGGILYHYETQYVVNKKLLNLLKRILHKQREALVGTIISINPNPYTYQGIICHEVTFKQEDLMRRKLYIKYDVEPNMYENIKYEIHTSDAFVLGFKELTS